MQWLKVGAEHPPEFDCTVERKFFYGIRLPETVQKGVLQDSEKQVTAARN